MIKVWCKDILCKISPVIMTKLMFRYNFKKKLDLKNPKDINEKMQYLKLYTYYNNPVITQCVDKFRVRQYLKDRGHEALSAKLIDGAYTSAAPIREHWDIYPDKFVIKCNHGCEYNILVTDKNKMDVEQVVKTVNKWLHEDFWTRYCEPQYRFVPKCVFVEEYLADDIETYKFYCFNGEPKFSYVSTNGEAGEKDLYLDYFDLNWNHMDVTLYPHLHRKGNIPKPKNYDEMLDLCRELSKDFPFVRVDLYNVDGVIYFSEFTFIPTGGNMKITPQKYLDEWGTMLTLPKSSK